MTRTNPNDEPDYEYQSLVFKIQESVRRNRYLERRKWAQEAIQPKDIEPFHIEWAGDVKPVVDSLWLIRDWLPRSGIAAIYGHPGTGKSFLALDMAAHIAAGRQWAGRPVEQGLVLYVVAEGQVGFRNRLFAITQGAELPPDLPFAFLPSPIDVQGAGGDTPGLIETISRAAEKAQQKPALIVIDSLSKTFGAGKENTDDMAGYLANCQKVSSAFDCLVMPIHHRPKQSDNKDLRGHSSLRGGLDTAILVEGSDVRTATVIKQKDGEAKHVVRFVLEPYVLDVDARGHEVSTRVVRIQDATYSQRRPQGAPAGLDLSGHAETALRAVEEALAEKGQPSPADIPAEVLNGVTRVVQAKAARDRLAAVLIKTIKGEPGNRAESADRTARRALRSLSQRGTLHSFGEWLWLDQPERR